MKNSSKPEKKRTETLLVAAGCAASLVVGCGVEPQAGEGAGAEDGVGVQRDALITQMGYQRVKDYTVPFRSTYLSTEVAVGAGQTLTVQAVGNGTTDPVLVIYDDYTVAAGLPYIIAINDDYPGLGRTAKIVYTNGTGSSHYVRYVAFAYSDSTVGTGNVTANVAGRYYGSGPNAPIGGAVRYVANVAFTPPNCSKWGRGMSRLRTYGVNSAGVVINLGATLNNPASDTQYYGYGVRAQAAQGQPTDETGWWIPDGPSSLNVVFSPTPGVSGTIRMTQDDSFYCET